MAGPVLRDGRIDLSTNDRSGPLSTSCGFCALAGGLS